MPPGRKRPQRQSNIDSAIDISDAVKRPRRSTRILSKAVKTDEQNTQEHAEGSSTSELTSMAIQYHNFDSATGTSNMSVACPVSFDSTPSPRERSPMITMAVPYPEDFNAVSPAPVLPKLVQAFYDAWERAQECRRRVIAGEEVYSGARAVFHQLALSVDHEMKQSEMANADTGDDSLCNRIKCGRLGWG
ncbi:hypothetical protein BGZ58_001835, partial [Dissophora ornata]